MSKRGGFPGGMGGFGGMNINQLMKEAKKIAKQKYNLQKGDLIVVTGGFPLGKSRSTNMIRILEI